MSALEIAFQRLEDAEKNYLQAIMNYLSLMDEIPLTILLSDLDEIEKELEKIREFLTLKIKEMTKK